MPAAAARTASRSFASLTPPALPRPPACTCALTTQTARRRASRAASTASSAVARNASARHRRCRSRRTSAWTDIRAGSSRACRELDGGSEIARRRINLRCDSQPRYAVRPCYSPRPMTSNMQPASRRRCALGPPGASLSLLNSSACSSPLRPVARCTSCRGDEQHRLVMHPTLFLGDRPRSISQSASGSIAALKSRWPSLHVCRPGRIFCRRRSPWRCSSMPAAACERPRHPAGHAGGRDQSAGTRRAPCS